MLCSQVDSSQTSWWLVHVCANIKPKKVVKVTTKFCGRVTQNVACAKYESGNKLKMYVPKNTGNGISFHFETFILSGFQSCLWCVKHIDFHFNEPQKNTCTFLIFLMIFFFILNSHSIISTYLRVAVVVVFQNFILLPCVLCVLF